jgi:hypothetical protein
MAKIYITIVLFVINLASCATSDFSNPRFDNNLPNNIPYDNNLPTTSPDYYIRSQPVVNQNYRSMNYSNPYIIPQPYYPNYDLDKYYVLPIKYFHPN